MARVHVPMADEGGTAEDASVLPDATLTGRAARAGLCRQRERRSKWRRRPIHHAYPTFFNAGALAAGVGVNHGMRARNFAPTCSIG
jgi:hypothetical protein